MHFVYSFTFTFKLKNQVQPPLFFNIFYLKGKYTSAKFGISANSAEILYFGLNFRNSDKQDKYLFACYLVRYRDRTEIIQKIRQKRTEFRNTGFDPSNFDLPIALRKRRQTCPTRYPSTRYPIQFHALPLFPLHMYRACVTVVLRTYAITKIYQ